jgi:TM2 domain-containing membrane protein YozV
MTQNIQPPPELPPVGPPPAPPKDPNTAFVIELVGGIFGLLGLGYMYIGRTEDGVIRLIAWLVYNVVAWIVIFFLTAFVIGCFCIPVQIAIQVGVSIWSATTLKNSILDSEGGFFG